MSQKNPEWVEQTQTAMRVIHPHALDCLGGYFVVLKPSRTAARPIRFRVRWYWNMLIEPIVCYHQPRVSERQSNESSTDERTHCNHENIPQTVSRSNYGLEGEQSDTDRRGIYLPSAEMHPYQLVFAPPPTRSFVGAQALWLSSLLAAKLWFP